MSNLRATFTRAARAGLDGQPLQLAEPADERQQVVLPQPGVVRVVHRPEQDQDARFGAGPAQVGGLAHVAHAEGGRALGFQGAGGLHQPVPVGVGLDDRDDVVVQVLEKPVVVAKVVQGHGDFDLVVLDGHGLICV